MGKKTKVLRSLIVKATLMSMAPTMLMASPFYYPTDRNYEPPTNIAQRTCNLDDILSSDVRALSDKAMETCTLAVSHARHMAEKYAMGEGKYIGCVEGLTKGIAAGYMETAEPTHAQVKEEETFIRQGGLITEAVNQGKDEAREDVGSVTDNAVFNRFAEVINTDSAPDVSVKFPRMSVPTVSDPYADVPRIRGDFGTYINEWGLSSSKFETRMEARAVYRVAKNNQKSLCSPQNVMFSKTVRDRVSRFNLWSYFKDRSKFNFEQYGFKDDSRSLTYLFNNENDLRGQYDIQTQAVNGPRVVSGSNEIVIEDAVYQTDELGNQVLDAQGNPIVLKPAVTRTEYTYETPIIISAATLKDIYAKAFTYAYNNYKRKYYSNGFYQSLDSTRALSEPLGRAIGLHMAKDKAKRIAFNELYKEDLTNTYTAEFHKIYKSKWEERVSFFNNNPIVGLVKNSLTIRGEKADGILKAGEKIKPSFELVNYGRQAGSAILSMGGSIEGERVAEEVSVAPSSKTGVIETEQYLGTIDSRLKPRERASFSVFAQGDVDFSAELDALVNVDDSVTYEVNEIAEIDGYSANLNPITGSMDLYVDLVNPSKFTTNKVIEVKFFSGIFGRAQTGTALAIEGTNKARAHVKVEGMDPLEIIKRNGVSGEITTFNNETNRNLHSSEVSKRLADKVSTLAQYYNAIANRTNGVNTGSSDIESRRIQVELLIENIIIKENENRLDYSDVAEAQRSIAEHLKKVFLANKSNLSEEAKAHYASLGLRLDSVNTRKKKAFRKIVNVFSPEVEVKKK